MRHPAKASFPLILMLCLSLSLPAQRKKEYFTEDELDLIRDAQELPLRATAYFKLADRRLLFLGLKGKSDKELEQERKEKEKREKESAKAGNKAGAQKPPEDPMAYLDDFTRAELLRGYIQAIDEVMSNIDDAYGRKLEVRDPLENLEKYTSETLPMVAKFQPKNENERLAMDDAVAKAKEALSGAKEALSIVPKTEKKTKR